MVEIKKFSGVMDTDSGNDFISPSSHKYARNVRFYGTPEGLRCENIMGNTLLVNPFLPNMGTNECIGAYEDVQKQRIFIFNWNSLGLNAIYVYNINAATFQIIIQVGTNPATDILNFDLNQPIVCVNIIYGDSQQGDILYWINSLKQPVKINIDRALGNITPSYGTWQRSFLDVIKAPPNYPPVCNYEDDNTVTVNQLNGQLFKFKVRWYYDDNDKSVTSSQSAMPLPQGQLDPELAADSTQNSVIKIVVQTGASNVYKVEILGAISLGNVFGDFFSIQILNKSDLSIPDNDTYIYSFYNNQIYAPIDINESIQLFDYVPQTANAQEVLLTNILIYGAITENYNAVTPVINFNSGLSGNIQITSLSIIAVQNGQTGFGAGNIHITVVGKSPIPTSGNTANIQMFVVTNSVGAQISLSYTSSIPSTTDIINGLKTNAIFNGYSIISSDSNNLIINKSGSILLRFNQNINISGSNSITQSVPTFDYSDGASYGLVHYDTNGRSSGVMTNNIITTFTASYETDVSQPQVILQITSIPPLEATYYDVVRIPNVTKAKLLEWITDRALPGTDPITNVKYVYLSIENLNQYIKDNPSTATQLGYSWATGDRLKILENMQTPTVYTTLNDFNIINSINNPTINGIAYTGQFLQLLPPSSSSGIIIDGINANFNFLIEIYTPSKTISQTANIYYEFVQRYLIGNAGQNNRFYQGQYLNGNEGAADISLYDGGYYMRYRTIYANNIIQYNITPNKTVAGASGFWIIGESFTQTFTSPDYTPHALTGAPDAFNPLLTIYNINQTYKVKAQFEVEITAFTYQTSVSISFIQVSNSFQSNVAVKTAAFTTVGQTVTISFDFSYTPSSYFGATSPALFYLELGTEGGDGSMSGFVATILGSYVNITIDGYNFIAKIIDQNFSDFYPSSVNNNGRAWAIQPNIEQIFTGTLVRYSLPYNIGTNINNINRFYTQNYDQYDSQGGDIQRFKVRDRNMRVFQVRKVGNVPIFQNVLTNTAGQDNIGQSENVINNIQYYEGEFGMGYQYTSLVSGKIQDYFVDPVRGYQIRVSNDGMIPISELYYGQYFIRNLLTSYNDLTYLREDGAIARIFGYYDYFDEEYKCILQGGTNSVNNTISNYLFSFNEKRNAYCSFYDFANTEFGMCAEQITYTFLNGNLYAHNNTTNYCTFYGNNFNVVIQVVFNKDLLEKKTWISVNELANDIFECPEIYTDSYGNDLSVQKSSLPIGKFKLLENQFSTSFLRSINSSGGLTNGSSMKGSYVVITFQKTNAQKMVYLSLISVRYLDSPLTTK